MKLSITDLELLAKLYGATTTQIQAPPEAADLVARMDRVQAILSGLSDDDLRDWIKLGERLLPR